MATAQPSLEGCFTFAREFPFELEGGGELRPVTLRYAVYGSLNADRDNAVLACHALSGSARVGDWWSEMMVPGAPLDPARVCVIGVNALGSCYGSTGPTSINPGTGAAYGGDFPVVSVVDMVRAQARLLDHLGVERLRAVVGGSIGGMEALAWVLEFPSRVDRCLAIGAAPLSAMGLALNHAQRQAIRLDPAWLGGHYQHERPPAAGLALARAIAMCTYKSAGLFDARFGRRPNRGGENPWASHYERFEVAGYLDYQGAKLVSRFDANSYLVLSKAMDTFGLRRGCGSEAEVLANIEARVLLVGITSDWLFPADDIRRLGERMRAAGVDCDYIEFDSDHGHDAFLAEAGRLATTIGDVIGSPGREEITSSIELRRNGDAASV